MESQYLWEYDNPYRILAHAVVGFYRPADVIRMLTDDEYLLNCVSKEVRQQDLAGIFVDCIVEDILAHKKRMELMHALDELAQFLFNHLDKKRLRSEIVRALSEIGIEVS